MPLLSYIRLNGTSQDVGWALGQFGAAAVHGHLLQTPAWANVMQWRGSAAAATMASLVQQRFPAVWAELQGLALGLQLPLDDVFLWNCRGDLWAMAPDGCTTVQLPGKDGIRISHNEDGDPGFAGKCAIAECHIEGSPGFAVLVYPGSLPGHTFAVTDAGLVTTVNNLRQLHVDTGVPRMVLTRAVLNATSLDDAIGILQQQPRAGGFHLSLADRASPELLSVEFSSAGCSVRTVTEPAMHANHAIHSAMRDFPQRITGSSGYRQVRGDALLAQAREQGAAVDPLAILGDTAHPQFPILREDPADSDNEITLASADIRVYATHVDWTVYEHLREPARFRMIDGHAQKYPKQPAARD